ncbi:MAG: hypothetical protein HY532_05415 [Chloroflexi bacterium]|nr:hypothetical protein [Chloroflexota bacterium]
MMRSLPLTSGAKMIALTVGTLGVAIIVGFLALDTFAPSESAPLDQTAPDTDRVYYQRVRVIQGGDYPRWTKTSTGVVMEQFPEIIVESWTRFDANNLVIEGHDTLSTPDGRVYQEGIMDRTGKLTTRTIWDGENVAFPARELGQIYANPDAHQMNELGKYMNDATWTKVDEDGDSVTFRQESPVTANDPPGYSATVVLSKSTGSVLRTRTEHIDQGLLQEVINESYGIYDITTVDPKVWEPTLK